MAVPNISATYHIMNASRMKKLRKGAVLCNVGRGPQVDTDALCEALDSGHLFGAAVDVTEPEPLPDNHQLWSKDRVIITPHISGELSRPFQNSIDWICRQHLALPSEISTCLPAQHLKAEGRQKLGEQSRHRKGILDMIV